MSPATLQTFETSQEVEALQRFKVGHPELFKKSDAALFRHLGSVLSLLVFATGVAILIPQISVKILFGAISAFCWFSLINVTIHHHTTHRNAAAGPLAKKVLDMLFWVAVPSASKRKTRYTRAHLNHHLRPFHATDVDHLYGTHRFLRMMKNPWTGLLYFLELTFVGAHVPGWMDDRYMNEVPLEKWNLQDYEEMKKEEIKNNRLEAAWQWAGFLILAGLPYANIIAWGWIFPMLLVKNWAHFLGQFQHYEPEFLEEERSLNRRTRTYRIPSWLNYLAGGEISGHFLHHLFPEMPYYNVETARRQLKSEPGFSELFVIL